MLKRQGFSGTRHQELLPPPQGPSAVYGAAYPQHTNPVFKMVALQCRWSHCEDDLQFSTALMRLVDQVT